MDIVMLLNFEVIKLFIIDFKHIWKFIYKHRQSLGDKCLEDHQEIPFSVCVHFHKHILPSNYFKGNLRQVSSITISKR